MPCLSRQRRRRVGGNRGMVRDLVLLDDWRRLVAANLNNDEEDCLVDDCDDRASHPLRGCQIDASLFSEKIRRTTPS